jgi:hypothetical protein
MLLTYQYSRQMPCDVILSVSNVLPGISGATYSACTLEFFTSRSQIHTIPLTPMVLNMMINAGNPLMRYRQ